jgi:hypothetical protein
MCCRRRQPGKQVSRAKDRKFGKLFLCGLCVPGSVIPANAGIQAVAVRGMLCAKNFPRALCVLLRNMGEQPTPHPSPLPLRDCVATVISTRSGEIFSSYVAENARSLTPFEMTNSELSCIATQSVRERGEDRKSLDRNCLAHSNGWKRACPPRKRGVGVRANFIL